MKIKIINRTGGVMTDGKVYKAGFIYEVKRSVGDPLVGAGHAHEINPCGPPANAVPETATSEPDAERAVKPAAKKRTRKIKGKGNGPETSDSGGE